MRAKIIVNGKVFDFEINDEQLKELESKQPKRTGYERVEWGNSYYVVDCDNDVFDSPEDNDRHDNTRYINVNYYSDETVAKNNARADKLMRQLRRFAVEHRGKAIDWFDNYYGKYSIHYDYNNVSMGEDGLVVGVDDVIRDFGQLYFDSMETASLAIKEFKDELTWYFTEYKDSL